MNDAVIFRLIVNSPEALREVGDFRRHLFDNVLARMNRPGLTSDEVASMFANYIWSAIEWNRVSRISAIKDLEYLGTAFRSDEARVRRDGPITDDVTDVLHRQGVISNRIASFARPLDGRERQGLNFLRLGEPYECQDHDGTVFGWNEPGHITSDWPANSRKTKRMIAMATRQGRSALVRVDNISSDLLRSISDLVMKAQRAVAGPKGPLRTLGDFIRGITDERLRTEYRKNLTVNSLQAARQLEIEFHMTDRERDNQADQSIATWTKPYPLAEFAYELFELIAPIRGRVGAHATRLDEIELQGARPKFNLRYEAIQTVLMGAEHARRVLTTIAPDLVHVGIHISGEELRERDEDDASNVGDMRRVECAHYLDRGSPVLAVSEKEITDHSRLSTGRGRIVARIWQLREDSVKLRAYFELFRYRHERYCLNGNRGPLVAEFLQRVQNPVLDWYRELTARYEEGVVYERDLRRRAGGMPLAMPNVPGTLKKHRLRLVQEDGATSWMAQRDDHVICDLLLAIDPTGRALDIWRMVDGTVQAAEQSRRDQRSADDSR